MDYTRENQDTHPTKPSHQGKFLSKQYRKGHRNIWIYLILSGLTIVFSLVTEEPSIGQLIATIITVVLLGILHGGYSGGRMALVVLHIIGVVLQIFILVGMISDPVRMLTILPAMVLSIWMLLLLLSENTVIYCKERRRERKSS